MSSWFAPGDSVVFRAYAVDPKSHKVVDPKVVKYFYVTIPNEPNVKLTYGATAPGASSGLPWTGTWTVPASYPTGVVPLQGPDPAQAEHRQAGEGPVRPDAGRDVAAEHLGDGAAPCSRLLPRPGRPAQGTGTALDASLYVDTVNGTRPVGAA